MGVFEVDKARFSSLARFNAYLADQGSEHFNNDLYIVAGFSHLSERELHELLEFRGYSIEDLGAIQKIGRVYDEPATDDEDETDKDAKRAEYYLYYDETSGVILFYTDMRKTEEIDSTVGELLADEEGLHYLYVSPRLFRILRETARQETHGEVTRFIADRLQESDYPARIRPEYERTIQYHGDDGLDTLAEMETNYGVRPRNITFNITNVAKFRVVRDGVFALERGDVERFFEYVHSCIEEAQKVKDAFDASSFEMLPATDNLSVPTSDPTTIQLSGSLNYEEVGPITSQMRDEGYLVVDSFRQEGSVYFTSKVIDTEKQNTFRLRASEDEIRVFPQESESHVGSFLRFHEFVQNHVDPNASVAPVES
jgi:hypothetical protein